jgi:hypothetical protein
MQFLRRIESLQDKYPLKKTALWPWWRGVLVIVSAIRTDDRRFVSRQGVRILGLLYIAVVFLWLKFTLLLLLVFE